MSMKKRHIRRALRNLGLAALAALVIWCLTGFPLPMEAAFRRCERQALAERSAIVWTHDGAVQGDKDLLVGLASRYVHIWLPHGDVRFWPRQAGGTLVPLPAETRYQDGFSSYLAPALLVPDPPEGAERARLTITLSYEDWSEDYVVEGERQGEAFFFQLRMRHRGDAHSQDESNAFVWVHFSTADNLLYPCTVEFFDADGEPLSAIRQEGRMTVVYQ